MIRLYRGSRGLIARWGVGVLALGIASACLLVGLGGRAAAGRADATGGRQGGTAARVPLSREGRDVVGRAAPEWGEMEWLNSAPLSVRGLRGKVVVIRFWTNTCPYCEATAPALRQLDREFRERGAVVIGMYHPKPPGSERPVAEVERMVRKWGWTFPVGLDMRWEALQAFWLGGRSRSATSATFVVDRRGVIRFVHPGPEFHPGGPADHTQCRADYRDLRQAVDALLAPGDR